VGATEQISPYSRISPSPANDPEDVTYHHCHASAEDLTRRVDTFEARLNRDPFVVADRLWVKDRLNPEEEKLRFPN
jgi:hypothetical protein